MEGFTNKSKRKRPRGSRRTRDVTSVGPESRSLRRKKTGVYERSTRIGQATEIYFRCTTVSGLNIEVRPRRGDLTSRYGSLWMSR